MKKIRSRQLLKTVCLVILGGLLVMGLAGCDVRKNSRAYLEGKAAELDRVFPTENLEDLFEEFPGGFTFSTIYWMDDKDGWSYAQKIKIKGDGKTRKVTGLVKNIRTKAEPVYRKEVLKKSEITYQDGQLIFENPDFTLGELETNGYLMQKLEISKNSLSKLKLLSKSYNLETGDGSLSYELNNTKVSNFLKVSRENPIVMYIDIDYETIHDGAYKYGISLKQEDDIKYVMGITGNENLKGSKK
ncbi:hypothetical protein [Streptococcus thoraltensis]|uniref:hypothetical protein n=1 Tax=Streptococcus thoraltensis TaxID=55085 RepID=UPI001FD53570|nr:hypothetical protein [Streptococcus thoraltensis]